MNRITLYSYSTSYFEDVFDKIFPTTRLITNAEIIECYKNPNPEEIAKSFNNIFSKCCYIDLSLMILGDVERTDTWLQPMILLLQEYLKEFNEHKCDNITFIIDKRYAEGICQNLPYFFSGVERIEEELEIDKNNTTNIVDIPLERFHDVEISFAQNLFGNRKFKQRLFEELHKFRILNEIKERKVFSVFLCGPSGIGKTETARLLHNYLAPKERFIKINLGNYSEQNALSSLIGSPRGFIGSSKGELTEKINSSKSRVILIDEFEKASVEVHNFFLELLSDGRFTDSMGREYDLDKYIVLFTSNLDRSTIGESISPELRSRFDLKYQLVPLNDAEKREYIDYKGNYYLEKLDGNLNKTQIETIKKELTTIDAHEIVNLRELNRAIESIIFSSPDIFE